MENSKINLEETVCPSCGKSSYAHPEGVMVGDWSDAEIAAANAPESERHFADCDLIAE